MGGLNMLRSHSRSLRRFQLQIEPFDCWTLVHMGVRNTSNHCLVNNYDKAHAWKLGQTSIKKPPCVFNIHHETDGKAAVYCYLVLHVYVSLSMDFKRYCVAQHTHQLSILIVISEEDMYGRFWYNDELPNTTYKSSIKEPMWVDPLNWWDELFIFGEESFRMSTCIFVLQDNKC